MKNVKRILMMCSGKVLITDGRILHFNDERSWLFFDLLMNMSVNKLNNFDGNEPINCGVTCEFIVHNLSLVIS